MYELKIRVEIIEKQRTWGQSNLPSPSNTEKIGWKITKSQWPDWSQQSLLWNCKRIGQKEWNWNGQKERPSDFPGGPAVKNLSSSATVLSLVQELGSYMPRELGPLAATRGACVLKWLSLCALETEGYS